MTDKPMENLEAAFGPLKQGEWTLAEKAKEWDAEDAALLEQGVCPECRCKCESCAAGWG